jgi:hypothetical protein
MMQSAVTVQKWTVVQLQGQHAAIKAGSMWVVGFLASASWSAGECQ